MFMVSCCGASRKPILPSRYLFDGCVAAEKTRRRETSIRILDSLTIKRKLKTAGSNFTPTGRRSFMTKDFKIKEISKKNKKKEK
jgi:hypothetical protein